MKKALLTKLSDTLALKAPFTRCPVCGGTTSMGGSIMGEKRDLYFHCYSCNSKWDLSLKLIEKGEVVRMPLVHMNNRQAEVL
jgi:formate dehydrogenase maturation protein FdhE